MELDRNQEKAANHVTGPAIVIAGPGSGKTTVVTARILNLIQEITNAVFLNRNLFDIAFDFTRIPEVVPTTIDANSRNRATALIVSSYMFFDGTLLAVKGL